MSFLETNYLYFILLAFTLSYPIAQSFERRIKLYTKFKYICISIFTILIVFIPWDIYFTQQDVWCFNSSYISGVNFFNLPIEEALFFVIVPFACVFIYEVLNYFIKKDILKRIARPILALTSITLMLMSFVYLDNLYTFICFLTTGISLLLIVGINPIWLNRFLFA